MIFSIWATAQTNGWEKLAFAGSDIQPAVELGDPRVAPWNLGHKLASAMSVALIHGEVRSSFVPADALSTALGRPNREQVNTTRASAATTLQLLELTNGETLNRLLKQAADKVMADKPASNHALIAGLYAKALCRQPTDKELQLAGELLGQPATREHVQDLIWSMAMLPEFQLIY